jgi:hypothetical protein
MELRGTDWAQDVINGICRDVKSPKKRAALAAKFAELGRYTDESRQLLRNFAANPA